MNRITRCPSCATVYQVGDAQLQQAQAWLRCGHCAHVFDSTGLVLTWSPSPTVVPRGFDAGVIPDASLAPLSGGAQRVDADALLRVSDPLSSRRLASEELASFEQALSSFRPAPLAASVPPSDSPPAVRAADVEAPLVAASEPVAKSVEAGALAAVVLACALLLQLIFVQSSTLAAHWPVITPSLAWVCAWVGCQVTPLRDPDALVIESSSFVQRQSDHVLSWTVRNTSTRSLGVTAMEVSLLDAQDQVLVRRVLQASQWGGDETLAPGQHYAARLVLRVDPDLPISAYRLLSFYP